MKPFQFLPYIRVGAHCECRLKVEFYNFAGVCVNEAIIGREASFIASMRLRHSS